MRRKLVLPYFRGPRESVGFRVLEICLTYVVGCDFRAVASNFGCDRHRLQNEVSGILF